MKHGFNHSPSDLDLYIQIRDNLITIIILYVDDLEIIGNNDKGIASL